MLKNRLVPGSRIEVRVKEDNKLEVAISGVNGTAYVIRYDVVGDGNGGFWLTLNNPQEVQSLLGQFDRLYLLAQQCLNIFRIVRI